VRKRNKNRQMSIRKTRLKMCSPHLVHSQIWLNLPIDDWQLGCTRKIPKKPKATGSKSATVLPPRVQKYISKYLPYVGRLGADWSQMTGTNPSLKLLISSCQVSRLKEEEFCQLVISSPRVARVFCKCVPNSLSDPFHRNKICLERPFSSDCTHCSGVRVN
jgi:hypothetical protein